jgi:hypothetical protein
MKYQVYCNYCERYIPYDFEHIVIKSYCFPEEDGTVRAHFICRCCHTEQNSEIYSR